MEGKMSVWVVLGWRRKGDGWVKTGLGDLRNRRWTYQHRQTAELGGRRIIARGSRGSYFVVRLNSSPTLDAYQRPPRAVATPRAFIASAIPDRVVIPAA